MLPNLLDVPLVLKMRPALRLTDDELFDLCQINDFLRIEQDAQGSLIIALPVYGYISHYNFVLTAQVGNWAFENKQGLAFDSSVGFVLPNGAMRSPDCSWVLKTRLAHFTPEQWERFPPLCPDFLLELCSHNNELAPLKAKMEEYWQNGARLGWLIDPQNKQVFLYRQGTSDVETLDAPMSLSGEAVLPGFVMDMTDIWTPPF